MKNQFRSKAFIKIKHNVSSATNALHLQTCRRMIENAEPILTIDELDILKDFLLEAWERINPVGESFANEMETRRMKQINNNQ